MFVLHITAFHPPDKRVNPVSRCAQNAFPHGTACTGSPERSRNRPMPALRRCSRPDRLSTKYRTTMRKSPSPAVHTMSDSSSLSGQTPPLPSQRPRQTTPTVRYSDSPALCDTYAARKATAATSAAHIINLNLCPILPNITLLRQGYPTNLRYTGAGCHEPEQRTEYPSRNQS